MDEQTREENMRIVREARRMHEEVQQAGDLKEGVPINFTTLDGQSYKGVVVFKRLDIRDYMRLGGIKAQIYADAGLENTDLLDSSFKVLANALATLSVAIVQRPEWLLDLFKIREPELLFHVFQKYEAWERSFRKPVPSEPTGADEAAAGEGPLGSS